MRATPFLAAFLFATAIATAGKPSPTLRAIAGVETGNNPAAVGPAGELSAWQFTRATWRQYTSAPFGRARADPVLAELVARTHLERICADLRRQGCPVTPYAIARRWNPGAGSAYAYQVATLAAEFSRSGFSP